MGQYWIPVNLTKREFIHPHRLGSGLKLAEQLGGDPGSAGALVVLLAAMPSRRGGGDLDLDENWHGPERIFPEHNVTPGPMPEDYRAVAQRTIGRWAGDQIALVGDYAEDADLSEQHHAASIYARCFEHGELSALSQEERAEIESRGGPFLDVTEDVCRVLEHELRGKFVGEGWRRFLCGDSLAAYERGEIDEYKRPRSPGR